MTVQSRVGDCVEVWLQAKDELSWKNAEIM